MIARKVQTLWNKNSYNFIFKIDLMSLLHSLWTSNMFQNQNFLSILKTEVNGSNVDVLKFEYNLRRFEFQLSSFFVQWSNTYFTLIFIINIPSSIVYAQFNCELSLNVDCSIWWYFEITIQNVTKKEQDEMKSKEWRTK